MDTRRIAGAALALLLAAPAAAQENRTYVGLGLGQSTVQDWDRSVIDDGSFTSIATEDSDTGFRLVGGMELNPNLAIEVGYTDFGEATADGDSDGTGFFWFAGPVSADLSATGIDLGLIGRLPVSEGFSVHARLGLLLWDAEISLADSGGSIGGSDDGNDPFVGIGAEFGMGGSVALRGDFVRYSLDDIDVDTLALTLIYRVPG